MDQQSLDAFWAETLSELAGVDADAVVEPAPEHSGREYTTTKITLSSWNGVRLRGWYSVPKDAPRGRLAAVLTVPGYSGSKQIPYHLALAGYAVLTLL